MIAGTFLVSPIGGAVAGMTGSAFAGLASAIIACAAWLRPDWLLMAAVAAAPVLRSVNQQALPPEIIAQAKTAIVLTVGIFWGLQCMLSRTRLALPRGLVVLISAWLGLTALAVMHAADPLLSLAYLQLTAAGLAAFFVTFQLDRSKQRRMVWLILGVGGALGLLVILQYLVVTYDFAPFLARFIVEPRTQAYYASNPLGDASGRFRPSGTMFHPNSMGLYFAVLLPFACALLTVRSLSIKKRLCIAGFALLMGGGLYATNSRGASVAVAAALIFLCVHASYRRLAALGLLTLLGAGFFYAAANGGEPLLQAFESMARFQAGLSGRTTVWENALALIHQAPFLGVGPGNFSTQYVSRFGYFVPNSVQEQMSQLWTLQNVQPEKIIQNFHAHNIYLQLAGELGVLGPLLFIAAVVWIVAHMERCARDWAVGSTRRALALAAAALAVGVAVYGFFDSQYAFTFDSINLVAAPLLAAGLRSAQAERLPW
jgi:hypothetical protein